MTRISSIGRITLTLWFALAATLVFSPALGRDIPALRGRVNDYGNILSNAAEQQLTSMLADLEKSDSTQIVVATIDSLQGENLEEFSIRLAEQWQIGQSGVDNGALLLVAVKDRKVRIEVGYGLEGKLTDLQSGRIIRQRIVPYFKQGQYDQGVIAGVQAMIETVRGEYDASQAASGKQQHDDYFGLIALVMFFLFFISNMLRRNRVASAVAGGIGVPLLGTLFQGFSLPLLLFLIPVGIGGGLLASIIQLGGRTGGGGFYMGPGGFGSSSGGFGGGGGFGGFSGGGGGFGGGGASGGW